MGTIALIGSSRFKQDILDTSKFYNLLGNVVIHSDVFTGADGYDIDETQIQTCIENGHKRIDMADEVIVVNPDGYIGDSTKEEISYAIFNDKPVKYLVEPKRPLKALKLFVSYPMFGKTDDQVTDEFNKWTDLATNILKNNKYKLEKYFDAEIIMVAYINSICEEERSPMGYLAHSIEMLDKADIAFFAEGYNTRRGCKFEFNAAKQYETPVLILPDKNGNYKIKFNKKKRR